MGVLFLAGRRAKAIPFESTAVQFCRTRDRLDRRRRDSVVPAGRPPFGSICRRNIHSQQHSCSAGTAIRSLWPHAGSFASLGKRPCEPISIFESPGSEILRCHLLERKTAAVVPGVIACAIVFLIAGRVFNKLVAIATAVLFVTAHW